MAGKQMKCGSASQHHQIMAAIIQQQNRAIAQQNIEIMENIRPSKSNACVLQQLDKQQFHVSMMHSDNRGHDRTAIPLGHLPSRSPQLHSSHAPINLQTSQSDKINDFSNSKLWWRIIHSLTLQNLSSRDSQAANGLNSHLLQSQPSALPSQASIQSQNYQQQSLTIGQMEIVRVFDELIKECGASETIHPTVDVQIVRQTKPTSTEKWVSIDQSRRILILIDGFFLNRK